MSIITNTKNLTLLNLLGRICYHPCPQLMWEKPCRVNIPVHVLRQMMLLLTFLTHHSHRRLFPPALRQPAWSLNTLIRSVLISFLTSRLQKVQIGSNTSLNASPRHQSPCCCLASDTEVSITVTPDYIYFSGCETP